MSEEQRAPKRGWFRRWPLPPPRRDWLAAFLTQLAHDLALWLAALLALSLFRAIFLLVFRDRLRQGPDPGELLAVFGTGWRYDLTIASALILPSLALGVACIWRPWERRCERLRLGLGLVFAVAASLACIATIPFFQEFNEQFNFMIFQLIYDDTWAIVRTAASSYHAGPWLLLTAGLSGLAIWGLRRLLRHEFAWPARLAARLMKSRAAQTAFLLGLAGLYVAALRGSLGHRPIQLKDAAVAGDPVLCQAVLNPFVALRYAVANEYRNWAGQGVQLFIKDGKVRAAAEQCFGPRPQARNLDDYLVRQAQGHPGPAPRHVFLLVMESYEGWALDPRYASLGIAEGCRALAAEGLYLRRFLPASIGTMSSLGAILTGLPDAGLLANYERLSATPYPTAPAAIFRSLGYRTCFWYGGYGSWQRLATFARQQGFDEVYSAGDMGTDNQTNEWGVEDEALFRFALERCDDRRPTFNVIMTTSFHPPYSLDVRARGWQLEELPAAVRPFCSPNANLNKLGHFWYADREAAGFVRAVSARLPDCLAVLTGDHSGRRNIAAQPTIFEKECVPLILYGPSVLRERSLPADIAGSHLDILPTLVELAAPAGFRYHAMGRNLFTAQPGEPACGRFTALAGDRLLHLAGDGRLWRLDEGRAPPDAAFEDALRQRHDLWLGLSWWRLRHGPEFP